METQLSMDLLSSASVCRRATKLFQSGLSRAALDIIGIELELQPDQGSLWLLRGTILHAQGDWPTALAAIETASLLVPLTQGGQLVLADCYSHTDKHELASIAYKHLLAQETLPIDYYAGLYAGFKRAGQLELALSTCRKALELSPDNDDACFGMAHCMSGLAFPPRQITTVLRKAVELAPDKSQYRISLALQLVLTKRRKEAYQAFIKGAPGIIATITCKCIALRLLELCAWAGDETRCSQLGGLLARLGRDKHQVFAERKGTS